MIPIQRGEEPSGLAKIRAENLARLRSLGRAPRAEEIEGYRDVTAEVLWRAQHYKCAWCEQCLKQKYNDVDHYRPKAEADRGPACKERHGYWWLAYHWDNLLYTCPDCNRSHKRIRFPLETSIALRPENPPPGREKPWLLDPAATTPHPAEHIEFWPDHPERPEICNWRARPRNFSLHGHHTIDVLGLNSGATLELRSVYIRSYIQIQAAALRRALNKGCLEDIEWEWERAWDLLTAKFPYIVASADAFRYHIPDTELQAKVGVRWPAPRELPGVTALRPRCAIEPVPTRNPGPLIMPSAEGT